MGDSQPPSYMAGRSLPRDADRHVETFAHKIDHRVLQHDVQLHVGMLLHERRPKGRKIANTKADGGIEAQAAAWLRRTGSRSFSIGDLPQDGLSPFIQLLPAFGKRDLARAAVYEPRAKVVLQVIHISSDIRW